MSNVKASNKFNVLKLNANRHYFTNRKFEFWKGIRRLRHLTEISPPDAHVSAKKYIDLQIAKETRVKEDKAILAVAKAALTRQGNETL